MHHANLIATVAASPLRIPVIWGIHQSLEDLSYEKRTTRLVIQAAAWVSRSPKRIVYVSSVGAKTHASLGFANRRMQVIPNGYDTHAFMPDGESGRRVRAELAISPDAFVIGLIARVHPMKDHMNFLRAASLFAREHPNVVFVLVGDGTEPNKFVLLNLIEEVGLTRRVRLCGRRSDIAAVNNALDIATSSSWGEAFPNSIAEAMSCGTPCVGTDVGDVREIIGETGIVVPPRDPGALSAGWMKLAALDASALRELGLRARARIVGQYSLGAMANRYADLYANVSGVST